jgi:hypothetical protein
MPVKKLENIERGSIICDPNDPKQIYKVIEKITVFDGYDCDGGFSYGVSKTIARCKNIGDGRMYRYPISRKFILVKDNDGMCYGNGLWKTGSELGHYGFLNN